MKPHYGKNIHVIGIAGTEGSAVLSYLQKNFPRSKITGHDYSEKNLFLKHFLDAHLGIEKEDAIAKGKEILNFENIRFCFRDQYLKDVENADTIFVPQSWYLYPENKKLFPYQKKFFSITRMYFDLFPGKIIGVTGSNGKTTTTIMIAKIMKRFFPRTLFTGNDRRTAQALFEIEDKTKDDWLVLEISNRQLKIDLGRSPDISVITNITPNHLTEHKDFEDYARTKASLLQYQKKNQWSVLNADDPESIKLIEIDSGETMPFSLTQILPKGVFIEFGNIVLKHADNHSTVMSVHDFPLQGSHNLSNALAAVAATYLAGVDREIVAQELRSLKPIPQRLELITEIDEVVFYNDTASTGPESSIAAIQTLSEKQQRIILIMGGRSKGMEYERLAKIIAEKTSVVILLKSSLSEEMKNLLKKFSGKIFECDSLEKAVAIANQNKKRGDAVLFSPAGEYFVYFKNKMTDYKKFRLFVKRFHFSSSTKSTFGGSRATKTSSAKHVSHSKESPISPPSISIR